MQILITNNNKKHQYKMEELTKIIQTLWQDGMLSKHAYAELLNFTNTHQALQLLQPDVIQSVCKHEYITDANWKSLTCRLCNDRIEPTQTVL